MRTDNLRARLLGGQLLLLALIGAGFGLALYQFVEVLERELLHTRVTDQLRNLETAYRKDARFVPPAMPYVQAWIVRPGEPTAAPEWLLDVAPGLHQEMAVGDRDFDVARTDVGATRLYVVLDVAPVERLESILLGIAGATLAAALAAAGLSAWRFSVRVDAFVEREQAFTGDVSHELRTPLAIILSATELLAADPDPPVPAQARVERIERAAARMHGLVEAMLYLAREDAGVRAPACPLGDVLREVVAAHRADAAGRGLELRLNIETDQTVAAPPAMAGVVIDNLVRNAVDHADPGVVEVTLGPGLITVGDTGPGIASADLPRVFERGWRGARSQGSGLGLAIVKRICDRLGWVTGIESRPGTGTRIHLKFSPVG